MESRTAEEEASHCIVGSVYYLYLCDMCVPVLLLLLKTIFAYLCACSTTCVEFSVSATVRVCVLVYLKEKGGGIIIAP